MKKRRAILMSGLLVLCLCTFTACGKNKNNAADETKMGTANDNKNTTNDNRTPAQEDRVSDPTPGVNEKTDAANRVDGETPVTDNTGTGNTDSLPDGKNDRNGVDTPVEEVPVEDGTRTNDGTVSGELGNTVKDIGDGVGNAVEDMGDAVGNAVDGR